MATAWAKRCAKSLTAGHSARGLSGATTWTPLPPVTIGKLTDVLDLVAEASRIVLPDAILDRLVHNAHRIELAGESMRRTRGKQNQKA